MLGANRRYKGRARPTLSRVCGGGVTDRHGALTIAWGELARGQRRTELPDVAGLADARRAFARGIPVSPFGAPPFPIAKPAGRGLRWLALLHPAEEAEYLALGARLVGRIERSMHPAVMANRASVDQASRGRLRLEPLGPARARWRREVGRLLASGPGTVVLADVRDCYASIRGDRVADTLLRVGSHPDVVGALGRLLGRWETAGTPGLPVGPLPSAVLANAVLGPVDLEVAAAGWRHVRWVDDLVIAARDRSAGAEILERLRTCLARLGLGLAEEKCRVTGPDDRSVPGGRAASGTRPALRRAAPRKGAGSGPGDPVEQDLRGVAGERLPEALRALRRLSSLRLGGPEAAAIGSVANDQSAHELVRAWAWRALARTDARAVLERAAGLDDEPAALVRRAVAIAAAVAGGRSGRAFLAHHARTAEGAATAGWGLAR